MESVSIGLDIGSSAVRAAEIVLGKDRRTLRRFAQVGLPPGAVRDGEIVNVGAVSAALGRLWELGGFSERRVVLGVSGPRVIVRQAEVPALNEEDLRSSLKFDAQDLIPIPMEEACFDFTVLERSDQATQDGKTPMRILLAAVHRGLLREHLAAVKAAGLDPVAIDATPLALLRTCPPASAPSATEVVVSIGAELTTIAVRQDGVPRFMRSLTIGGARLTASMAASLHLETQVAESLKRRAVLAGGSVSRPAEAALAPELRELADDVKATVDFFLSQADGLSIDQLLVTGGAAQTAGLLEELRRSLDTPVALVDPYAMVHLGQTDLDAAQLAQAGPSAVTAIGLALWPTDDPAHRLSVLPEEIAAARRARKLAGVAGVGLAGLVAVLALTAGARVLQVHHAEGQARSEAHQAATLQAEVTHLRAVTVAYSQVQARHQMVVTALTGDVDWVRVLGQFATVLPSNLSISGFTGTAGSGVPTTGAAAPAPAASGAGSVTFTVSGAGGLSGAAQWVRALESDPDFQGTWVSAITTTANGGTVKFSSNAKLTPTAQSNRAASVPR